MKLIDIAPAPAEPPAQAEQPATHRPERPSAAAESPAAPSLAPFGFGAPSALSGAAQRGGVGDASTGRAAQLTRDAVLSATPVQLLTMLYDRLLLDLGRAENAQLSENWAVAGTLLQHAQAILTELSGSLKLDVWDGADGLLALYTYVSNALVMSNINRDVARTREAIALLEPLRAAWHDAAALLPARRDASTAGGLGIA